MVVTIASTRVYVWPGLHVVTMISSNDLSQEIPAVPKKVSKFVRK